MVSPPSTVSVCPSLAPAGQVVWTQSYGPSCSSCVLSSRGVSGAAFCCLGLLSHPLLQWSSLDSSYSLVVQLLVFSWTLCWSSFLSLPVFADSSGWLSDIPWLSALSCLTAGGVALVFCRACRLALVGLRCLWVPRSCGAHGLRDLVPCLWSGLWSSLVLYRNEDFPSFWWVWFLTLLWGPLPQAGAVFFGLR